MKYELTKEQYDRVLAASQPVAAIALHCGTPASPQENANAAWKAVAAELGCKWDTIRPYPGMGPTYITAEPI